MLPGLRIKVDRNNVVTCLIFSPLFSTASISLSLTSLAMLQYFFFRCKVLEIFFESLDSFLIGAGSSCSRNIEDSEEPEALEGELENKLTLI